MALLANFPLRSLAVGSFVAMLSASSAFAQDMTLRLHTLVQDPHPYNDMAAFMAEQVSERTSGAIAIQVFDAGQLGQDDAVIGEMGLGTIDLMISSTNNAVSAVPQYQIFSVPYLFTGFDDLMERVGPGSAAETYYRDVYEANGVNMQMLALGGSGSRNMSNSIGPVESLSDIQGIKMRTPPSPMISRTWETLGTLPVSVAWGELYAAIQTGVADGLESSIPGYAGAQLFEVAPYLALTAHTIQVNHISMSDRAWGRLSEEQQQIMLDVAAEASTFGVERAEFYEASLVDRLQEENDVTVTRPDTSEFKAALSDLQSELAVELNLEAALAALFPEM
ncbi:MAG: TRAP transporter substrate-binding protein [Pseudomonadota bacterium]